MSTCPTPSRSRPGWLASALLLSGLVGATSMTAYGVSIHEPGDDEAAIGVGVFEGSVVLSSLSVPVEGTFLPTGVSFGLAEASLPHDTDELIRIKRAKLKRLAKEIKELELRRTNSVSVISSGVPLPTFARVTRSAEPGKTVIASPGETVIVGKVVDSAGRVIDGTIVSRSINEAGVVLSVRPVQVITETGAQIALRIEPTATTVALTELPEPEIREGTVAVRAVETATTVSGAPQEIRIVSGISATSGELAELRSLGYVSGNTGLTTLSPPSTGKLTSEQQAIRIISGSGVTREGLTELRSLGYVSGNSGLTTATQPDNKAELKRLADEVELLKQMIQDLNRKLSRKPKSN